MAPQLDFPSREEGLSEKQPLPNPQMQPTGRTEAGHRSGGTLRSALWNEGLCGRQLEGLQLICKSLGGPTSCRRKAAGREDGGDTRGRAKFADCSGCLTHKGNYITAYAMILMAVLASGVTTILVAAEAHLPKEFIAGIAALPGFIVLILNTIPFDARADWWSMKQRRLEALRRSLLFEAQDASAVSKAMTQFIDMHNEKWPTAHFALHQRS